MSIEDRVIKAPVSHDPSLAVDAKELFPEFNSRVLELIGGMAGSSSFLRGVLHREANWFKAALRAEPEQTFAEILTSVDREDFANLSIGLRIAKRRVSLLLAACDLGGIWELEDITRYLTVFADFAVETVLRAHIRNLLDRGKLPGCGPDDLADCAGVFILAMGKMGAFELNYSSDIDLIVMFDDERHKGESIDDVRVSLQRITRQMTRMLSDITSEGYVFRTDLRLRPNPSVTPVCVPKSAAEIYYESEGQTWERAAFIKARVCAGDIKAGTAFLDNIEPFIWRKYLDFAAIKDAHDMRLRIREHKGFGGPIIVAGHDIKLGRGGIREIEFFAQTKQLIAGGRDSDLRSRGTVEALNVLAKKGWMPKPVAQELVSAYREHREIEHRIQMMQDVQTQLIPASDKGIAQLANLSGYSDVGRFVSDQMHRLQAVHDTIDKFFEPPTDAVDGDFQLDKALRDQIDVWAALPPLRSQNALRIFERLRPDIEQLIAQTTRPEFTLNQLDAFMRHLPAGVQLFSLFEANPQILNLLLDICASAPRLAKYLSLNPMVLNTVFSGQFFRPLPDEDWYLEDLQMEMTHAQDYEDVLNITRRWQKEQHFRIGVLMFRLLAGLDEVEHAYSDLAAAVVKALLPWVEKDVARRFGTFNRQTVNVVAMGKLGSRQMTATSDLDLIVLYDVDGEVSDGPKSLAPGQYFARLTQTLITAFSSMSAGKLYEVDMRLRPSGGQGPMATSIAAFEAYQMEKAWTWEHLALTRGRVIAGDAAAVDVVRKAVLGRNRDRAKIHADVVEMRERLAQVKGGIASAWNVKDVAGGILDIELTAQMVALLNGMDSRDPRVQLEGFGQPIGATLKSVHRLLCTLQQAQRLVMDETFDYERLGNVGLEFFLGFAGFENWPALESAVIEKTRDAALEIERILSAK